MAGYIRQDTTNNIADGNVINASDFDNEYNAIEAAFHASTGHTHDGTAAEGAPITKVGPAQDLVVGIAAITPKTDNTLDLGSALLEFKDLYIDGTANIDSLVADTADINAGTIDGTTIGGSSAAAGTFTTATATTGNITTVNATTVDTTNLEVTNIKAKDGTASATIANSTGVMTIASSVLTTADINGGTIDNTAIGGATPAAGSFTTLGASGAVTLSGGTANGVLYLDGSKVATSGSALTFDGTTFKSPIVFAASTDASGTVLQIDTTSTPYGRIGGSTTMGYVAGTQSLWTIGGSEQMRLNSTGLGIGTSSPGAKLGVFGDTYVIPTSASSTNGVYFRNTTNTATYGQVAYNANNGELSVGTTQAYSLLLTTNNTTKATLDSSGNLGLGVTPSAWGSGRRSLSVSGSSANYFVGANANATAFGGNFYYSDSAGNNVYQSNGYATLYLQSSGQHQFFTAPSGTAGAAISFTQAMTLDASGNLLVGGTSSALGGSGNLELLTTKSGNSTDLVVSNGSNTAGSRARVWINNGGTSAGSANLLFTSGFAGTRLVMGVDSTDGDKFKIGNGYNVGTGTTYLTLDTSGNLGLGVTPSAWSQGKAFELLAPGMGLWNGSGSPSSIYMTGNAYFNGGFKYGVNGEASHYYQYVGQHVWSTAPYGTAGNAISFTQAMTLDASGNLGLGVTPSAWGASLKAVDIGSSTSVLNFGDQTRLYNNAYLDASNVARYKNNATAVGYIAAAGTHAWFTAPSGTAGNAISFTQAMTLDASGNLGIGVTGPTAKLHIYEPTAAATRIRVLANGGQQAALQLAGNGTTFGTTSFDVFQDGGSDAYVANRANASLQFWTNNTERARITSGGDLLMGTTSDSVINQDAVRILPGGGNAAYGAVINIDHGSNGVSGAGFINFYHNASNIGSISQNGTTAVSYNTSSDYRLKDNPQPLTNSGAFIDALQPKTWEWKTDGSRGVGFIAHEVQAVSPTSVVGEKDAVDADGKPVMQAMEYGSAEFIANIIAELQSLRARVAALETN